MSKKTANPYELSAEADLIHKRIDRVAQAVDANAAEFDARLRVEGNLSRAFERHALDRLGELGALRDEFKACTDRGGKLHERISEIEAWADDLVAVQRENADADNKNAEHVYEQLALVEQLASLTAQRLLKAEGEIKAAHARASAAGSRWLGLNARLYVLEGVKNRRFFDRLWWLAFGE